MPSAYRPVPSPGIATTHAANMTANRTARTALTTRRLFMTTFTKVHLCHDGSPCLSGNGKASVTVQISRRMQATDECGNPIFVPALLRRFRTKSTPKRLQNVLSLLSSAREWLTRSKAAAGSARAYAKGGIGFHAGSCRAFFESRYPAQSLAQLGPKWPRSTRTKRRNSFANERNVPKPYPTGL